MFVTGEYFNTYHAGYLTILLASWADILRGSSHIPAPLTVGGARTCDKPLGMSAWEVTILDTYSTIKKHFYYPPKKQNNLI